MSSANSTEATPIETLIAQLHIERERLRFVLENITEEVYFADAAGRYVFANAAARKEFGHRSVDGVPINKIIAHMIVLRADGSVRPVEEAPPLRALTGEVIRGEEQLLRTPRAGELRRRRVNAAPVCDPAGTIVGSVAVVRDIAAARGPSAAAAADTPATPGPAPDGIQHDSLDSARSARNVEIKARVAKLPLVEARARELADQGPFDLSQDDTFFACASGRLKLREFAPDRGELIFYRRADRPGPKLCEYTIVPTHTPAVLRVTLGNALGVIGRVRKRRRLYVSGTTRIHLDEVESLGPYLELEVVLGPSQSAADGEDMAHQLLQRFGIHPDDLVTGSYLDLLKAPRGA